MAGRRQRRLTAGAILIAVGSVFLLFSYLGYFEGELVLAVLGVAFLAAYLVLGRYGLLIPGAILLGLGLGGLLEDGWSYGSGHQLGLGLGFLGIYVLAWARERSSHWWPLIPGGILTLTAVDKMQDLAGYVIDNWPVVLIVIGVLLVLGGLGTRRGDDANAAGDG